MVKKLMMESLVMENISKVLVGGVLGNEARVLLGNEATSILVVSLLLVYY